MQETGVDFLVNHLIDCYYYLLTHSLEIEQAKKIEKQQAEEFAIGFAEWKDEVRLYNEEVYSMNNTKELLEIYKKEKGL